MEIVLENVGKRFNRDWIFRGLSTTLRTNEHTVILGSNGSGKSTLLQMLSGYMDPSEGEIHFKKGERKIPAEDIFREVSYSGPVLNLYEELTLEEIINFHNKFKSFRNDLQKKQIIEIVNLSKHRNKQLKYFSSGMRQRVKLALAILSDTPLLLLDEPTSNLDSSGIEWYQNLIKEHGQDRLILVCSNKQPQEYAFCSIALDVEDYK